MKSVVLGEDWEGKVEKLLREAWYSGERDVLKNTNGEKAAIVPLEDLELLEALDR